MNSYSTFVTLLITPTVHYNSGYADGISMGMVCTDRFGFSGRGYKKLSYRKDIAQVDVH